MSRKSFNPQECIAPLNNVKLGMQMREKPMTIESLNEVLKSCGLPINSLFRKVLQQFNVLKRVSRGKYVFLNKEPIYIGMLQQIQKEYLKLARDVKKPKSIREICPEPVPDIDAAIDLLKKNGYLVFKPV